MREVEWINLKAAELRALAAEDAAVIVPVGSIEQHGPHLPVQVDTLLVGEIARRAARRVAASMPVVVAPTQWAGLAEHHMSLGGTLTLDLSTFAALLRGILRSVARNGFRRVLVLNGHGGNVAALTALAGELSAEIGARVAVATYWLPAAAAFREILEEQPTVAHACEAETSMLLALRPELVDMAALVGLEPPRQWAGGPSDVVVWQSVAEWSPSGVAGVPRAATAAKGERLLEAAAEAVAARIVEGRFWQA